MAECLPDNTALQVSENLSAYLVFPPFPFPPKEAHCIKPPASQHLLPLPCPPSLPCSQTVPSDAATSSSPPTPPPAPPPQITQGAQKTQETPSRGLGKGRREFLLKNQAKESTTPFPHLLLEPSLGETEPREKNQEGLDTPEPQTPPYIILCKKLLSPLSYIHRSSWQV